MSGCRYCERCGNPLADGMNFCDRCGAAIPQRGASVQPRISGRSVADAEYGRPVSGQSGGRSGRPEDRRQRYRQEELSPDWQESWELEYPEEIEEQRFTPAQYLLTGILVILLAVLISFFAYWVFGRSTDQAADRRKAGTSIAEQIADETEDGTEDETEAVITILEP